MSILNNIKEYMTNLFNNKGVCSADFHPSSFYNPDFETTVKNRGSYTTWFMYCLNEYFYSEDTNKDMYGDGTLTRYLSVMGAEIDENVIPYIECFLNMVDAQTTDPKFLNILAEVLGSPPNITYSEEAFRNLLTYIVSIYKIKGTKKSYELFFALLGYDIELVELPPRDKTNLYDDNGLYDTNLIYDNDSCQTCSQYDIVLFPRDINRELTKDIMDRIMRAIELNEPINAKLRHLKMGYNFNDDVRVDIQEFDDIRSEFINIYDVDKLYDNSEIYDESLQLMVPTMIVPMELDITNSNRLLNIILRFESIHQIENLKDTIDVTIIGDNMRGLQTIINTITNYVSGQINYDTYVSVPNIAIPSAYTYYYIQITIKLKNGSKVLYKSLYRNISGNSKEKLELYFS